MINWRSAVTAKGTVFNIEGGCYAKTINLSRENEPIIWDAIRLGSIVENVVVDPSTGRVDYNDLSISENGRCSYPLEHIERRAELNSAGEPRTIIFLTCDVSGALPPVAVTRAIVAACQSGELLKAKTQHLPILNLDVPKAVTGIPNHLLDPRSTWPDPNAYDVQAQALADLFQQNIRKFAVSDRIAEAGPWRGAAG